MLVEDQAADSFRTQFGAEPSLVVRAPGRVNLIGEHTDYNQGFVLPMAIDRRTVIASRPRSDNTVKVISESFGDASFDLSSLRTASAGWTAYIEGVAWALGTEHLSGWEGVIASTLPIGASLSSSAALEVAAALTFAAHSGLRWDPQAAALTCQRAENEWVGVRSGIMDQLIVAIAKAGHAALIDCRDLSSTPYPLPAETAIVVLDTSVRRDLKTSDYNRRRAESEAAAGAFERDSLRDVTLARIESPPSGIDKTLLRRARHVVGENERTLAAARAMAEGNASRLGALMDDSHESLRSNFEVSGPELDAIVDAARNSPGCFGARMTGAGFAGCALALVAGSMVHEFMGQAEQSYSASTGRTPALYACSPSAGASIVA